MKSKRILSLLVITTLFLTACSGRQESSTKSTGITSADKAAERSGTESEGTVTADTAETKQSNILVAYFTRLDNTGGGLDSIIQGGEPYGSIGNSVEDADMDAIASASITVKNGEMMGNTQAFAQMIHEITGGEMFSIQTEQEYLVDYDELIDYGEEEKSKNAKPELAGHLENMEKYDIIFLGFPNWWYDMPMPVYAFMEEYDFSGKLVILFATSAGSGFSDAVADIEKLMPEARVSSNGLHIPMGDVAEAQEQVEKWLEKLMDSQEWR